MSHDANPAGTGDDPSRRSDRHGHHLPRLSSIVSSATAALVGTTPDAPPAVLPTPVRAGDYAPKPTIVLVHGAFADSGSWVGVIRVLRELGYPVVAAPNHLRGLAYDAASVRSVLDGIAGPVVLVGHSYGGAVISNAAVGAPDIKALVYIAAFLPDEGESIGALLGATPGSLLGPDTTWTVTFPNPAAPGGEDTDIFIVEEHFAEVFAADVAAARVADLAATQRPLSASARDEPSGPPAWRDVPSWALVTLADNAIAPAALKAMAERAGAWVETVPASHAVMISEPQAVVKIILDAAHR